MTSVNYIKDDTGSTFIPSSQRPDGSWRRPIRVRDGYVPQEEQPVYVSKGKQYAQYRSQVPVGMTEEDVASYKTNTNSSTRGQGQRTSGSSSLYFDVGLYTPTPVATPIPGLNFVETPDVEKVGSKKKKSKSKNKSTEPSDNSTSTTNTTANNIKKNSAGQNQAKDVAAAATTTDPVKRLRNLRKRLKDIETLEKKIESGELKNPEKDQLEKIQRKEDVLDEIDDLQELVEQLNLS